jgi:hypothetical protein
MEFDNATNLDRKSGVRGTKKEGRSPTIVYAFETELSAARSLMTPARGLHERLFGGHVAGDSEDHELKRSAARVGK